MHRQLRADSAKAIAAVGDQQGVERRITRLGAADDPPWDRSEPPPPRVTPSTAGPKSRAQV